MIRGIGNDLIEIERIRKAHARWGDRFLKRVFTPGEIEYALRRSDPAPHLAARFAAKEAGAKALGTGIARGVGWKDIYVTREPGQAPRLNFSGRALERAERIAPGARAHLALTHSEELAQAFAILEN